MAEIEWVLFSKQIFFQIFFAGVNIYQVTLETCEEIYEVLHAWLQWFMYGLIKKWKYQQTLLKYSAVTFHENSFSKVRFEAFTVNNSAKIFLDIRHVKVEPKPKILSVFIIRVNIEEDL
jgi:hypothetical protein